jgi:perosamine synthetase
MSEAPWAESVYWLFTVLVDEREYGMDSRELLSNLGKAGVQSRPLWQPMHLSPAYADLNPSDCLVANRLYKNGLSLPCSVGLGDSQQFVLDILNQLASTRE